MKEKNIILVSGSPRRRELMSEMELEFTVDSDTSFEEIVPCGMAPEDVPSYFAEGKSKGYRKPLDGNDLLVSADTIVICDGEIMGKPHTTEAAISMLEKLSGKMHKVVSAVCVRDLHSCRTLSDTALVSFKKLSRQQIEHYVSAYSPMDKAGGYGIQEWIGLVGIDRIEGSFYTIMGLPTHLLSELLSK